METLDILCDISQWYKIIEKETDLKKRTQLFIRCYVDRPTEDEIENWTLQKLVDYIKETDDMWEQDLPYIRKCYLLCNGHIEDNYYIKNLKEEG